MAKTSTKTSTLADYGKRIERVTHYIFTHLDDELDVTGLAEIACFSPYHFHRVFHAMMGETVNETIRRLRLHRAAFDLLEGQKPIAAVAARAGYGSVEAFGRAFKASYGLPPAAYRDKGALTVPPAPRSRLAGAAPASRPEECIMYTEGAIIPVNDITFAEFEPVRLAAMRHAGPYHEIGRTFERLGAWAGSRGLFGPQTRCFGVYYDAPEAVAPENLRSDACITVAPGFQPDRDDVSIVSIPAGRCAVFRYKGPYAELGGVYRWIYSVWLPNSGEEPADRAVFEEYLNNPATTSPRDLLTNIYLPLA